MARNVSQTASWEYWIPVWNHYLEMRDLAHGEWLEGKKKTFGFSSPSTADLASEAQSLLGNSREDFLEDRAHTEMREDTAYQRGVADMRAAGLNPYTIGSSPASSSASSVGADTIGSRLQLLGYILDLKNLDAKNRKITNDAIGNVLGLFKKR